MRRLEWQLRAGANASLLGPLLAFDPIVEDRQFLAYEQGPRLYLDFNFTGEKGGSLWGREAPLILAREAER